ncbi:MAG: CDP-glycerol glycerophosphotransferase family protein, partial [bacterium]|nr:CDP-glycerol glycerophosphotransferase family protein [bacterium]
TGVASRLIERGFRVVLLTPYYNTPELFQEFAHKNLYIEPLYASQKVKLRGFFTELFKGAVFNNTVYARYRWSIGTPKRPNQLLFPFRMIFFAPLRFVPGARHFIRWLYILLNPLRAHDYLFEKYKPNLVFNTDAGGDNGVLRSAKRFDVPTVDMPKSWDGLSQMLFSIKADSLVVWNEYMRAQAIKLQGYKEGEIIVTGIPQFDFYARKDGLLSREAFCRRHGLDPKKKIILYGSAGANLFDESQYVSLIKRFMEEEKLSEANILVRPHVGYYGDVERFSSLGSDTQIVVDKSGKHNQAVHDPFDTSEDHVYNLLNSLYHADVCVNVASTLSLDAIACGTEVINFNFDIDHNIKPHKSVKRLFVSDYVKDLMATGGTFLARSKEEFLDMLKGVLEENKKKDTKEMIDIFIYKIDGKSAERITDAIINLM